MVKIIIDSAADFDIKEANALDISVIPIHVRFGEIEYLDRYELSGKQFFEKLIESEELPKTSQITPIEFENEFKKYPNDQIICITMSRKLSGTYQSACIAADEFDNVVVVDSENVTIGEKILVEYAVRLKNDGLTNKEIADILNEEKKNIKLVALLDTLEYLKKGGRISAFTAAVGGILNIKPVVEVVDGVVKQRGNARGSKMGNNKLRTLINEYGGINFDMPYCIGYSGLSNHLLLKYIEDSKDLYPENLKFNYDTIGCAIGTHVGPGAIAAAFFTKK